MRLQQLRRRPGDSRGLTASFYKVYLDFPERFFDDWGGLYGGWASRYNVNARGMNAHLAVIDHLPRA